MCFCVFHIRMAKNLSSSTKILENVCHSHITTTTLAMLTTTERQKFNNKARHSSAYKHISTHQKHTSTYGKQQQAFTHTYTYTHTNACICVRIIKYMRLFYT